MDKFSYNSYPDSTESSPRCREIDFENSSPWEDQQQQQQQQTQASYKVKFMCSYGGKIQPRPHDNQLTYVNGETKILSVDRGIRFSALVSKLSVVIGGGGDGGGEVSFKYQLPGEDLDALISVTNDDDLEHMMHEYDRLVRLSTKPARMRLFLFPPSSVSGGFGSEGSTKSDRDLAIPTPNRPESEKSVTAPSSNADFLFGSEKLPPTPQSPSAVNVPQQIPVPVEQRMIQQPEVNPAEIQRQIHEFQRIQIRDQEQQIQHMQQQHQLQQQQQQEEAAMYRRKSEDGRYFSPAQPTTVPQTNPQPPIGYWQGNNNVPGNVYTTTSLNLQEQQQVYMNQAQAQAQAQAQSQAPLYHSVMRPPVQGNQGYYPPVQQQYMEQQNQQGYNVVQQPQGPYSGGPQVMTSGAPMGSQIGGHVYYTVAGDGMMVQPPQPQPQPQYQGMGQLVSGMTDLRTGPDGKVVVNNMSPKVTDSV